MKNTSSRFENVVRRSIGSLTSGLETATCPDTYVGVVSDLLDAATDFPTRQEIDSRPTIPCVVLILESPHDKEFKGTPGPAKGATGVQIRRHLAGLLQIDSRSFGLLLMNAVQHQCSLGWAAAGFVDTDLSFLSFLELYRTDVAERRVTTRRVVEPLDVIEHISAGLFPGPVHLSSRALSLQ